MEPNKDSTVPIAPATTAGPTPDSTVEATGPKTVPADGTTSPGELPTASPTAPESTRTPDPTATTARSLLVSDPMAIIPAERGPPPQYDEHKRDAITTLAPAVTLPQTYEKVAPIGPHYPVAQGVISLAQLGEEPGRICCPFCFHEVLTRVKKESTSATS
ncbi:hypothetical protein PITC_051270 [Penicillium italicum]|uniref:LITAF domain-containing protein n=1 Tax=Penicillium italicum TaxID=40296 RepID=A0A0A2KUE0_PENIT|nr:hypothetical protein PITC_051270 [Penicillium italicum]